MLRARTSRGRLPPRARRRGARSPPHGGSLRGAASPPRGAARSGALRLCSRRGTPSNPTAPPRPTRSPPPRSRTPRATRPRLRAPVAASPATAWRGPRRAAARRAPPRRRAACSPGESSRLAVVARAFSLVAVAAAIVVGASAAAPRADHALLALNILPPGQGAGSPDLTNQIARYDGLTPLQGNVRAADLTRFYKPETLGVIGKPKQVERPRTGVTIYRDAFGVPLVYGTTRANTEFGAGWATAEDRGLYLQLLRGPARISALDVPGYDAFSVALSARQFLPSPQTEAFLASQVK